VSVRQGDAVAPERVRAYDDFADAGAASATDPTAGLASLRFMGKALRRQAWVWCATALAGMVVGLGLFAAFPPSYTASTSVLLTNDPLADPSDAIQTSVTLAQAVAVARDALQQLHLRQSVSSFAASYTVAQITDRILTITVTAPTSSGAVSRANALAAAFLQFRANALRIQQQIVLATLGQQIAQAAQQVALATERVDAQLAQPPSAAQGARLHTLQAAQYQAYIALAGLQHTAASLPVTTTSMVAGSGVLDTAVPARRGRQALLFYPLGGLYAGLMLGLGIVIIGALASDRLRRRDDVAHALGAPVTLSVGSIHGARWLPGRLRLAAGRRRDVRRIVAHLRRAVPAAPRGAALAAVSVDNARVVALPLAALAVSCARGGKRVVVADLAGGAPAARLLGVRKPGVHEVHVRGVSLVVAVPGRDDVVPVGPLHPASPAALPGSVTEALARAYDSADLLLTLVALDPALGGEHVATWATDVVVHVTSGRSSPAQIHAAGEMIRLAGLSQLSAVLIGADQADLSLGVLAATPVPSRWPQPVQAVGVGR
jgi:capsular polysaccharide biosynthesis protein